MTVASIVAYPNDLLQSRVQYSGRCSTLGKMGVLQLLRKTLREEKIAGLYRGFGVYWTRLIAGNVIMWSIYETLNAWVASRDDDPKELIL